MATNKLKRWKWILLHVHTVNQIKLYVYKRIYDYILRQVMLHDIS